MFDVEQLRRLAEAVPDKGSWRVDPTTPKDLGRVIGDDLFATINSYRSAEIAAYIAAVSPDVLLTLLDAYDGAVRANAVLRMALREVQWLDARYDASKPCPKCWEPWFKGHAPDCEIAAALAGATPERS